eukprot:scaffold85110_cov34-Prasinocladus_malaysianus.AAC.2
MTGKKVALHIPSWSRSLRCRLSSEGASRETADRIFPNILWHSRYVTCTFVKTSLRSYFKAFSKFSICQDTGWQARAFSQLDPEAVTPTSRRAIFLPACSLFIRRQRDVLAKIPLRDRFQSRGIGKTD